MINISKGTWLDIEDFRKRMTRHTASYFCYDSWYKITMNSYILDDIKIPIDQNIRKAMRLKIEHGKLVF